MKIGIDVDNVVADLNRGFCEFYNRGGSGEICSEDFKGYYLYTFLPLGRSEELSLWDEYHDSELFDEMPTVEFSKEILNILKSQHELSFITARHPNWKNKTSSFFRKHFPGDDFKIIYSGEVYGDHESKDKICGDLGINILIEDHPTKCIEYANAGIKILLLEKPWNRDCQEHENIIRVKDWNEILERIKELEEKNG